MTKKNKRDFSVLLLFFLLLTSLLFASCSARSLEKNKAQIFPENQSKASESSLKETPEDVRTSAKEESETNLEITVTFSVDASNILNNENAGKKAIDTMTTLIETGLATSNGAIYGPENLILPVSSTVYDGLKATGLTIKTSGTGPGVYISSIQSLGHFDGGQDSGWIYLVNGSPANKGADSYILSNEDVISWRYTLNGGSDISD